jgi:hypothetical protein
VKRNGEGELDARKQKRVELWHVSRLTSRVGTSPLSATRFL